jgi:2-C-methyl-D-erythritol 4-phosphate cytidylyltransferase
MNLWGVIPAAGSGERMHSQLPKQYLSLIGVPVLQRAIDVLLGVPSVSDVVVVLSADDTHWPTLAASSDPRVHTATGGRLRAESVLAGISAVRQRVGDEAWVLVHDAARPLLATADVQRLISEVMQAGAIGGLLAVPVQDTLKQASETQGCLRTVSRASLWQAQTPQLFRAGQLGDALVSALAFEQPGDGQQSPLSEPALPPITDEASALERLGYQPLLVEALEANFKITRPADVVVAEALLKRSAACE